jgi:nicotinamide-nucleotide amidase
LSVHQLPSFNMSNEITATILSIGDELLIGQTVNTNAGWIGGQLSLIGIRPKRVLTIGDDRQEIMEALQAADTDVVLITGGLGPTKDDITKQVLCDFFGTTLVRHPHIEARIAAFFESLGREPLEVNLPRPICPRPAPWYPTIAVPPAGCGSCVMGVCS